MRLIRNAVLAVSIALFGGCGANASAIKQAEKACLAQDLVTLKAKLAAGINGIAGAEAAALQLTEGEIVCAVEALGAVATAGSAS
jgi:hypothetical protein